MRTKKLWPWNSGVTGTSLPEQLDDRVLVRLDPLLLGEHHPEAGVDQERAEEPDHPLVPHEQRAPIAMKIARKTERPEDPEEQHAVLVARSGPRNTPSTTTNTKMLSTDSEYSTT